MILPEIYGSHESVSLWASTIRMPTFQSLTQNKEFDVCIVGGGIAGITTAYLLQKEGKKVCILESNEIGSGQTGRTTAHFVTALDDRYYDLEKYHGTPGIRVAAESHLEALNRVEEIVNLENIACDFARVSGYLFTGPNESSEILVKEKKAVFRAGLTDVDFVNTAPLSTFDTGPALIFPRQIQLHPLKYIKGLTQAFLRDGGEIYTHTHVTKVQGGKETFVKTKDRYEIKCASVVVATNTPVNDLFAIHTKQAPYRTYVIGVRIPKGTVPKALFWDTLVPYHYLRINEDENDYNFDTLIVGGEDHKTGQNDNPEQCYVRLESWTRERFPEAQELIYRWSGQVMEPVDGLGFLGHNPMDKNNIYVITGDSGNGMTHCTVGAILVTDQIMGRKNAWENLYDPSRITFRAAKKFLKENLNAAAQYADWLKDEEVEDTDDIQRGEGAILREGLKMIAAYKDEYGNLELFSAACPHLGGVVRWNKVEKTWDCPCHGSRFDCHGTVVEGPASTDLKLIEKNIYRGDLLKVKLEKTLKDNFQDPHPYY